MTFLRAFPRLLVLPIVAATLLGGLGAGLARLGWSMDSLSQRWLMLHGPLMICGFLGTLICLERAVALASSRPWAILVPLINGVGAVALLLVGDTPAAKSLLLAGSLGLLVLYGSILRIHLSRDAVIMATGALSWSVGNALWLAGAPIYQVVHWWTAFLLLTIIGERLELSRVRRLPAAIERLLLLSVGVYLAGVALTLFDLGWGIRLLGVGAILMAGWLLRYDIARRTVRYSGLPRYIAASLLTGYVWLAIGGAIGIWKGALYVGPEYAALLHAFLLGFVFSMIFGHMPIILPALSGLRLNYTPLFYVHLILLHATLAYRMAGTFAVDFPAQQWGGLLNVVAVLLFLVATAYAVLRTNVVRLAAR